MLFIFVIAACGRHPVPLTDQEKRKMSELTRNLKPQCVGRYVIDIPGDALILGGATVQGVKIESKSMSREAFRQDIAHRGDELRQSRSIDEYPLLYEDREIEGSDTHIFISRSTGSSPADREIEAYKWDRGYRIKLYIGGSDFLHPDQTTLPSIKALSVKNDVPGKTRLVFDLAKRLRGRADETVPSEPGLCFLGAFLPGQAGDHEYAWAQFVLASNRDVSIGMDSNSTDHTSDTLLQRANETNRDLEVLSGRTIRKGTVALQGMNAEEWLFTGKNDLGIQGTKCLLEANAITSGAHSPLLTLDLDSGSPNAFMRERIQAASMSESEAVALWDVISRTLRPRPNGF